MLTWTWINNRRNTSLKRNFVKFTKFQTKIFLYYLPMQTGESTTHWQIMVFLFAFFSSKSPPLSLSPSHRRPARIYSSHIIIIYIPLFFAIPNACRHTHRSHMTIMMMMWQRVPMCNLHYNVLNMSASNLLMKNILSHTHNTNWLVSWKKQSSSVCGTCRLPPKYEISHNHSVNSIWICCGVARTATRCRRKAKQF